MKIFIALILSVVCSAGVFAQNGQFSGNASSNNPQIFLPDTARYRIISLESSVVKLDRYTGKTYRYALERRWYPLDVRGGLPVQSAGSTPKYEIYEEGQTSFLINLETGQSWIFNYTNWEPIRD